MPPFAKLLFSALAASTFALQVSAGSRKKNNKSDGNNKKSDGGKCPRQTTPAKADGNGKCPEGRTMLEFIVCASGPSGFDNNSKDFDIFRHLVIRLGVSELLGGGVNALEDSTLFLPFDFGMAMSAEALGYEGDKSDEAAVFQFYNDTFTSEQLTDIFEYHVSTKAWKFMRLQKEKKIDTLEGESIIMSEMAMDTPHCDERVRLRDAYRREKRLPDGQPKIHNAWQDIGAEGDNIIHVIKAVLLPAAVLPELMPTSCPCYSRDDLEKAYNGTHLHGCTFKPQTRSYANFDTPLEDEGQYEQRAWSACVGRDCLNENFCVGPEEDCPDDGVSGPLMCYSGEAALRWNGFIWYEEAIMAPELQLPQEQLLLNTNEYNACFDTLVSFCEDKFFGPNGDGEVEELARPEDLFSEEAFDVFPGDEAGGF